MRYNLASEAFLILECLVLHTSRIYYLGLFHDSIFQESLLMDSLEEFLVRIFFRYICPAVSWSLVFADEIASVQSIGDYGIRTITIIFDQCDIMDKKT